jgi:putative ABC transport system permease protein
MNTLLQDLRYGARNLIGNRSFAFVAVLTLALGIGACTAIFSVVNAVLLRPLPFPESDRIVAIQEYYSDGRSGQVTPANFLDWRAQNQSFAEMAAFFTRSANLTGGSEPERMDLVTASASFFQILGIEPHAGRLFLPADEQAGHAPVVVLSHALWQQRFGGDASVLGKTITLNGQNYTVIGVTPPGLQYPKEAEAWIPPLRLVPELNAQVDVSQLRGFGYLSAIARLKPEVTLKQAQAEMEAITARLRQQYPETNSRRFDRVVALHTHLVGEIERALLVLLGAVGAVLLIACANVANLLLARTAARQREIAIRTALGAGRFRLIQQLLTESVLLAMVGGAAGLLLAWWGIDLLRALAPGDLPRVQETSLDLRVLGFTLAASLITGIIFGLAPAWQLTRAELQSYLKEGGRSAAGGARRHRLRGLLVVAEVALSLVLLIGAGLLFRSFLKLQAVEPGFDPGEVLTMRVTPSGEKYRDTIEQRAFYDQAIKHLSSLPGVEAVGVVSTLPLSKGAVGGFQIEGRPQLPTSQWPGGNYRVISPDYFRALGVPILHGRAFAARDTTSATNVVIINQSFARRNFEGENPIGKRISFARNQQGQWIWFEIVGVAADVRSLELQKEPEPDFFATYSQVSSAGMSFVIRASAEPTSLAAAARNAIQEVDAQLPVSDIKAMEEIVYESIAQPRFNLLLLGVFASVAIALAAAGIYGVMAYTVTQRTQEIGIRMALGAQASDVLRLVVGQGMLLTLSGVGLGLIAARSLTHLMKSLLYGISAIDTMTFALIALLLTGVALAACYIPARRATKVDPMVALRYE